jgi:hypothetical protein
MPKKPNIIDGMPDKKFIAAVKGAFIRLGANLTKKTAVNTPPKPPTSSAPKLTQSELSIIGSNPNLSLGAKNSLSGAQTVPKSRLNIPISRNAGMLVLHR